MPEPLPSRSGRGGALSALAQLKEADRAPLAVDGRDQGKRLTPAGVTPEVTGVS
jgi:hypothetical protein